VLLLHELLHKTDLSLQKWLQISIGFALLHKNCFSNFERLLWNSASFWVNPKIDRLNTVRFVCMPTARHVPVCVIVYRMSVCCLHELISELMRCSDQGHAVSHSVDRFCCYVRRRDCWCDVLWCGGNQWTKIELENVQSNRHADRRLSPALTQPRPFWPENACCGVEHADRAAERNSFIGAKADPTRRRRQ